MSKILLVEDSPTQAMQMKMLLESAEHEVVCCDDGTIALEELASGRSELVVTDLELPILNGLELIKRMRADFPQIPAVLVTAQGSERLAAEALQAGATAYVPKSMLNELLLGTVEDVLGVLRTDRSYSELIDCTVENRLVFELPNKPQVLLTAVDLTMQLAAGMQLLSGVERFRFATALQHAVFNAMYRGNLEIPRSVWQQNSLDEIDRNCPIARERAETAPYNRRHVHFEARLTRDYVRVVVRDDGRGFDTQAVASDHDPHALDADQGRGLVLIRKFVDKISFNDRGNEITLVKHCGA